MQEMKRQIEDYQKLAHLEDWYVYKDSFPSFAAQNQQWAGLHYTTSNATGSTSYYAGGLRP